jgi:predicted DNA-binding protein
MAKNVYSIRLDDETTSRIKAIAMEGNVSQWIRLLIEKELEKMNPKINLNGYIEHLQEMKMVSLLNDNTNIKKLQGLLRQVGLDTDYDNSNDCLRLINDERFGSIDYNGKKYFLTQTAYCDNYGTDGDVRYYAHAIDDDGTEYKVTWETSEQYDLACELLSLENKLQENDRSDEEIKRIKANIAELESDDIRSCYADDESNACDWDAPISVEEI